MWAATVLPSMVNTHQSNASAAPDRPQGWSPIHESNDAPFDAAPTSTDGPVAETGTTVVGLTTADGVVLAADRRASVGGRLVTNKNTRKVERVHPTAATALSGAVGHLQHFTRVLRAEARLYENRRGGDLTMAALATLAGNVLRSVPLRVQPLLGGVDAGGGRVYSVDGGGGVLSEDYVAGGSGIQLAYGVLEQHYDDGMTAAEGRSVAAAAVDSASERDTASGNGFTVATVTSDGVELADYGAVEEVA
jgi:proteasome beta subunit